GTDWGLPGALSVMLTAAFRVPLVVGVKVTLIWQLPFGATELGQLLLWAKSPLFVPVIWMDVMVRLIFPVFWSVTYCGLLVKPTVWFPKLRLVGESETTAPCTT